MAAVVPASSMTLLPAATAALHSSSSSPLCARWVATREEEQAVSVLMQGPAQEVKVADAGRQKHSRDGHIPSSKVQTSNQASTRVTCSDYF